MALADFTPASPGRGEVLVRVAAASVNALDWKIRRGQMRLVTGRRFPRGIGQDVSGTILQVGPGVTRFGPGDAVFGAAGLGAGAFAEAVIVKAKHLARKPEGLSFEKAATLPVVALTALQALNKADIAAGHRVYVNGAQGGVGQAATQLALARGASVAGSVRDPHSLPAGSLGLDPAVGFDVDPRRFRHEFDLVFDTAGKMSTESALRFVRPGGQIIDIVPTAAKILRTIRYRQYRHHMGNMNAADLESLGKAVVNGDLDISIARTVPLGEAIPALTELEERGTPRGGKLVIIP